jgi:hypothetical protein
MGTVQISGGNKFIWGILVVRMTDGLLSGNIQEDLALPG